MGTSFFLHKRARIDRKQARHEPPPHLPERRLEQREGSHPVARGVLGPALRDQKRGPGGRWRRRRRSRRGEQRRLGRDSGLSLLLLPPPGAEAESRRDVRNSSTGGAAGAHRHGHRRGVAQRGEHDCIEERDKESAFLACSRSRGKAVGCIPSLTFSFFFDVVKLKRDSFFSLSLRLSFPTPRVRNDYDGESLFSRRGSIRASRNTPPVRKARSRRTRKAPLFVSMLFTLDHR